MSNLHINNSEEVIEEAIEAVTEGEVVIIVIVKEIIHRDNLNVLKKIYWKRKNNYYINSREWKKKEYLFQKNSHYKVH